MALSQLGKIGGRAGIDDHDRPRRCWRRELDGSEAGVWPLLQVVVDAQPGRWVHGDVVEVFGAYPGAIGAFVVDGEFAAGDGGGGAAQRELLAHSIVGVGDDVVGVGVYADQSGDGDLKPGFFADFADRGLLDGFADLMPTAGNGPQIVVAAAPVRRRNTSATAASFRAAAADSVRPHAAGAADPGQQAIERRFD